MGAEPGEAQDDLGVRRAFAVRGRPAVSPGALALVSVLQYAEGLTDRQAADQVRARMDWKFPRGSGLAARDRGGAGPAGLLGPAVPPRREGGAPAGGQGSPAGSSPVVLAL
ncbi:transposase [Streptomyces sp. NBC_00057]|uniref:transposase n=1 Tax=Streptomyces sp. NBC_00057 TaxID=2975634 RepID=UPI0038708056